jgi:Ca2+-binding RTX toxin-like protein
MRTTPLVAAIVSATLMAVLAIPGPAAAQCQDENGTTCDICGTEGDDTLIGTAAIERICGLGGNDYIEGGGGSPDCEDPAFCWSDYLWGGPGNDILVVGSGEHSFAYGGTGDDMLYGGDGSAHLDGDAGNDVLYGGAGDDDLWGEGGNDRLYGEDGDDFIIGGGGHETISGGTGDDLLAGEKGHDTISGGPGNDRILGEAGRDSLFGNGGLDFLNGGPGRGDRLRCGAGNDGMKSTDGVKDDLDGGAGIDQAEFDRGLDVVRSVERRR